MRCCGEPLGIARSCGVWIIRLPRSRGRGRMGSLEPDRRKIAERRVPPARVGPAFYEVEDLHLSLRSVS
jgi:hypothetical protein